MKKSDDEIKNMAGHPDVIPEVYRNWYLKGYRAKEAEYQNNPFNKFALGQPTEPTAYCPNCGELCWASDLNHTSTNKLSVLWGVCGKCADIHTNFTK